MVCVFAGHVRREKRDDCTNLSIIDNKMKILNSYLSFLSIISISNFFSRSWTKCKTDESGWVSGVATSAKNAGEAAQQLVSESEAAKFDQIVETTLEKKIHFELRDFDSWLDNPAENDFTNFHIENLLSMFMQEC